MAESEVSARYRVIIGWSGSAFVGLLEGRAQSGAPVHRSLTDVSCAELVSALALVTALSINPPEERAPDTAAPPPPAPSRPAPERPTPSPVEPGRYQARAGVGWDVLGGVAPSLGLMSADVSAEALYRYSPSIATSIATALRVALVIGESSDESRSGIEVSYRWLLARVGVCPVELALGPAVRLATCAAWQVGDLRAVGSGPALERSQTAHLLWSGLDATLRTGFRVLRPFWLELEGGVLLPFHRASFIVSAPRSVVYRTSDVGFLWRSGLVLQIP